VRNTVNVISFPFRYVANFIGNGAEGFVRYFKNIDKLIDENNALKEENKNLRDELADKNAAIEENDRLRDYLELYETHTSYYFKEATVIGYESSSYMSTLTLNVGSLHGISKKMPVIVTDGIVGHVSEVGLNWCRVVTLIENYSSVGAYTDRTGALGVVEGDYSLKDSGLCYFKNIKADADVKVGDKVVSSGVGSIYPEGFEIGEEADDYFVNYRLENAGGVVRPDTRQMGETGALENLTGHDIDALEQFGHLCFATVTDGKIVSAACTNSPVFDDTEGDDIEIGVETAPGYEGRGCGRSNVAALSAALRARGCTALYECASKNIASMKLVQALGGREYARNYYIVGIRADEQE
jgi:rod shape-determining protein MreC